MRILLGGALAILSVTAAVMLFTSVFWQSTSSQTASTALTTELSRSLKPAEATPTPTPIQSPISLPEPPERAQVSLPTHYFQTFNNCGPATLAMILNYYGEDTNQTELGRRLRPYQNLAGDNDDKSVTLTELAAEAERRGYVTFHRPAGDLELLQQLVAAEIPVLTRTWTQPTEDIGHYRVVTGYDERERVIIQDDSLEGKNIAIAYDDFLVMWEKFNYELLVVVEPDQQQRVIQILGPLADKQTAWERAKQQAAAKLQVEPQNTAAGFNLSVAEYELGNYQEAVTAFEAVEAAVSPRTLWYQIEPLQAYYELKQFDELLPRIEQILNNGNRAYAELYYLRGLVYEEQGNSVAAQNEFAQAVRYNQYYQPAQAQLERTAD